jgi:hypothetical protein
MGEKKNFPLRIDEETFNKLKKWADDDFRSINSHIEFLLREALKKTGRLKDSGQTNKKDNNE